MRGKFYAAKRQPKSLAANSIGTDVSSGYHAAMILEPFGDISDVKINVDYRGKVLQCGTKAYHIPQLVVLEYPNGQIRLIRESEIDSEFGRLKAEVDENDQQAGQ